jgi:type I restriction enzyme S subunit
MCRWNIQELGKVSSIHNGSTPSTSVEEFWNGNIIWITPKDLSEQNRKYIEKGERYITKKGLSKVKSKLLPKGTLLLSSRAPIGLLSIAKNELVTNQGFKNIIVDENQISNEFLYYYLKLKVKELNNLGTGTTFKELSKSSLEKFKVKLPDLPTQQKIASVLSALDDKIELNNRINAELEAMAKTLYDYWFVQFDFPNEEAKPYKSSGGKMVYNETLKREIPEGWEVKTVGELVNIFDSKRIPLSKSEREKKKGIFPYYGATEIMDYINDFIFDGEYILLAEDGSVMNSEGFPILQYIYGKTWVNNHAHVLQSKQIEYTEYLYKLLEMIPVILIKSGSIQMKINQDNLLNYKLLVAPETLILKYSKFAKSIRQKLIQNQKQNQELSALRDWLLPMLMNGQVKVGEIIL